jgi:hypothetical protein
MKVPVYSADRCRRGKSGDNGSGVMQLDPDPL